MPPLLCATSISSEVVFSKTLVVAVVERHVEIENEAEHVLFGVGQRGDGVFVYSANCHVQQICAVAENDFAQPALAQPGQQRIVIGCDVALLSSLIEQIRSDRIQLEHVYAY